MSCVLVEAVGQEVTKEVLADDVRVVIEFWATFWIGPVLLGGRIL
ncbi:MAG: hypothetical protein V2A78_01860 [bacterium]